MRKLAIKMIGVAMKNADASSSKPVTRFMPKKAETHVAKAIAMFVTSM
jgi:hypothetical protein